MRTDGTPSKAILPLWMLMFTVQQFAGVGSDTPSLHTISSKWNEKLHPWRLTIMEAKNHPIEKGTSLEPNLHARRPEGPPAVGESQEQGHNPWKTLYQQRYNSGCFSCLAKRGLPKKVWMGCVHNDFVGWSHMMRLEKTSLFFLVSKWEMGLKP